MKDLKGRVFNIGGSNLYKITGFDEDRIFYLDIAHNKKHTMQQVMFEVMLEAGCVELLDENDINSIIPCVYVSATGETR